MHREGHYGTTLAVASTLLLFLPISIAIYGTGIMLLFATLPDKDHRVARFMQNSWLVNALPGPLSNWLQNTFRHRGIIHTYLFGAVVATTTASLIAIPLHALNAPALSVGVFMEVHATPPSIGLFILVTVFASWVIHIYTDALTVGSGHFGVKPYAPFSNRQLRFGYVKAANKWANAGLLLLGLLLYGALFYYRLTELGALQTLTVP